MNSKQLITAVILLPAFVLPCRAQLSSKLAEQFSPSVVRKVYDNVAGNVQLGERSQFWLAAAYARQDSSVTALILRGTDATAIKRYEDSTSLVIEHQMKKVLLPQELIEFNMNVEAKRPVPVPMHKGHIVLDAQMDSQFGACLKMGRQLSLTDEQSDSLLMAAALLRQKENYSRAHPDSGFFDQAAFESEWLGKILLDKQYDRFLANKNKVRAQQQALYDWHDLQAMGLAKQFNRDSAVKKLVVYYLLKGHITERFANDKGRRTLILNGMKQPEPLAALTRARVGEKARLQQYAW
jgi:hypothetical protein